LANKRYCVICNKYAEIEKVIPHEEYDEQIFGCGHIGKRINSGIDENISVTDETKCMATYTSNGQTRSYPC